MAASDHNSNKSQPDKKPLAMRWKVLISIALLFHLTAIVAFPWSMMLDSPAPAPKIPSIVVETMAPYLNALYCGHGYRFFCPAPGPSHLVRYTLEMPDGSTHSDIFPNLKTEWPRLFYHRHFMLSEKLAGFWNSREPDRDAPPQAHAQWNALRNTFLAVAKSYAAQLLEMTGAKQVTLEFIEHDLPTPEELLTDHTLNAPKLDRVLWTSPPYTKNAL